jgi:hypothetical protein
MVSPVGKARHLLIRKLLRMKHRRRTQKLLHLTALLYWNHGTSGDNYPLYPVTYGIIKAFSGKIQYPVKFIVRYIPTLWQVTAQPYEGGKNKDTSYQSNHLRRSEGLKRKVIS